MADGVTKQEFYRFDFAAHPCASCGKELVAGNVYYVEVPLIPNKVGPERIYCSGCAVQTARERSGRSVRVEGPDMIIMDDVVEPRPAFAPKTPVKRTVRRTRAKKA